jgi:hypothetical protein
VTLALPTEVIAALWGAGAGAASSIAIEWGKSIFHRKRRARAIKIAMYYEIFGHSIIEVDPLPNGDPNFVLLGFSRASYDAYLDEIPDLLPEKLVGELSTYYARVTTAASQQQRVEEDTTKFREAGRELVQVESRQSITHPVHKDEIELLRQEAAQVADRMMKLMMQNRIALAFAIWQQEELLATLRKEFRDDPGRKAVNVLPKYRDWAKQVVGRAGEPPQG